MRIFIIALLMIAPNWKQIKYPFAYESINTNYGILFRNKKEGITETYKNVYDPPKSLAK